MSDFRFFCNAFYSEDFVFRSMISSIVGDLSGSNWVLSEAYTSTD